MMEKKGSIAKIIKMRSNNSMLTSKSMLADFHETSITVILLMRQSK